MTSSQTMRSRGWIRNAVTFVGCGFLLSVVYGQSPLYTSNQNQYFLHGAARAGLGFLSADWLARTVDPAPVFSALAALTYRALHESLFYVYFALLCAVYLYSLAHILTPRSPARRLLTLTILLALHSALLRFVLTRGAGEEWAYLFDGGVAGQRLLGTVLQPSVFGVFLLLSVALFLDGRHVPATFAVAVAATIHPTYLLGGAFLVLGYLWSLWRERRSPLPSLSFGFLTLLLVLPIVLYVARSLGPTLPEITAQAQEILVEERIPHHAVVAEWLDATSAVKLVVILGALAVIRRSRIFPILFVPLVLGVAATALQVAIDSNTLALLFPWRISSVLVPLSTAILVDWAVGRLGPWVEQRSAAVRALCAVTLGLFAVAGAARFALDLREMQSDPAGPMIGYARRTRAPGQLYLIPPDLQQFRLQAGVPVLVDLKSIPYRDVEVVEWFTRMRIEGWIYRDRPEEVDCSLFDRLQDEYGVTHVVLDPELFDLACPALGPIVHQDPVYRVRSLRSSAAPP